MRYMCVFAVYLCVGGVGEDLIMSEFDQNILHMCITFLNLVKFYKSR